MVQRRIPKATVEVRDGSAAADAAVDEGLKEVAHWIECDLEKGL